MAGFGRMVLLGALVCFVIFFANVSMGAAGQGVLLGDVAEMLLLFVSALLFVVGVLCREAEAAGRDETTNT
ncbi:MAG: hypothetical protein AAFR16_07250 [Pseudomonadota bacterium]